MNFYGSILFHIFFILFSYNNKYSFISIFSHGKIIFFKSIFSNFFHTKVNKNICNNKTNSAPWTVTVDWDCSVTPKTDTRGICRKFEFHSEVNYGVRIESLTSWLRRHNKLWQEYYYSSDFKGFDRNASILYVWRSRIKCVEKRGASMCFIFGYITLRIIIERVQWFCSTCCLLDLI